MKRQALLTAIALLTLAGTATAQQKEIPTCTVRILLENQDWNGVSRTREPMSPDQTKWWLEDGQKKFKNFCFVSSAKPYDYRIVWKDSETYREGVIPTTTTTNGTVNAGGNTGTYSQTSTTNNGREVTYVTTYVQIRLFKADADPGRCVGRRSRNPCPSSTSFTRASGYGRSLIGPRSRMH